MLSLEFSRSEFESATNPGALAKRLADILTARLAAVTDPSIEVAEAVTQLKRLGHDIYSWDASDDFEIWGDSYVPPHGANRLLVHFSFAPGEARIVTAEFSPWPEPSPVTPMPCPTCGVQMAPETLLLRIAGSGSVSSESLPYRLCLGAVFERSGIIGNTSVHIQEGVFECPRCHGVWVPGQGAGA